MMEMIMVVFFFILCAGTCTLVFVKADNMSRLARDINQGVLSAESCAEVWKVEGTDGLSGRFKARLTEEADGETGSGDIFWSKDWKAADREEDASYRTRIGWRTEEGISKADIDVIRISDGKALFSMTAGRRPDSAG